MGHPDIVNRTPLQFAPLFVGDEEHRPLVVTVVKATLAVAADGAVRLAPEQEPIELRGKYRGEPGASSAVREPEIAFCKPGTDCVLQGHAIARRPVAQMDVGFRVGPLQKIVRVVGDRRWEPGLLAARASPPQPFAKMALVYERAFGGWDRTPELAQHHQCEPTNPVGRGFVAKKGKVVPGAPLPNLEDPQFPFTSPTARIPAACFDFVGHDWQPRAAFAGTYDQAWEEQRSPRLPRDFDRRYHLAASPGLSTAQHLRGDELVVVIGATEQARWEFALPGIAPPCCEIELRTGAAVALQTALDTVIVDADARTVVLLWRAHAQLRGGPNDVRAMTVTAAGLPARR